MTTTMPCQAPFQHQMCFVRSLPKLGWGVAGRHCNFFSPNAFCKTFHKRVFFANDSCCLRTSLSISNHTKSLKARMPRGRLLLTNTMEPVGLVWFFGGS